MLEHGYLCRILVGLSLMVGMLACNPQKGAIEGWKQQKHACGPGPEDAEIDQKHDRLLISCTARREGEKAFGEIVALSSSEGKKVKMDTLPRIGEPDDLFFQPHGISLVQDVRDLSVLYVVNHEDSIGRQSILKYEVKQDRLVFLERYMDELLQSPNSVLGMPDGSFYATNDMGKRGSSLEALLKIKGGSVLYCNPEGQWSKAIEKISYANGLATRNDTLLLTSTRKHQLRLYRIDQADQPELISVVKKIKGADNIRFQGDYVLIPGHPRILKFVGHASSPDKKSPSLIYRVDLRDLSTEKLFYDEGYGISACSSALYWKGRYWLVQVFDPFVLEIWQGD